MTDEKFVMKEDIRARKQMAIGSKHKVVGSKSKTCRFPSDYLTKKEKEALNGEMKSWNMNEFYTYEEFKQMPHDIQEQYINGMIAKYNVGAGTISECLFKNSSSALYEYARKHKLKLNHCTVTGSGAQRTKVAFAEAIQATMDYDDLYMENDISSTVEERESVRENIQQMVQSLPETIDIPEVRKPMVDYAELIFRGGIDYAALNAIVSKFSDDNVKITIRIQKE